MLSITQNPDILTDFFGSAKNGNTYYGSKITNLSSSQNQNTDITIFTKEGDRVTLSSNSQRQISYFTYKGLVSGGEAIAKLKAKSYSVEVNQEFSITIEGDLSAEELKDIQKSIKTIDNIMHQVLSGNTDNALTMVYDISSMESISGFSADLAIENTLSFEQQTTFEAQTSIPETREEIDSAQSSPSHDRIGRVADKIIEALKHQGFKNRKLIKPLNKYFSKLFEGISEKYEGLEKSEKMKIAHRIHSEILERMENETHKGLLKSAKSENDQAI